MIIQTSLTHQTLFNTYILGASIFAGIIASVSGFGIGSLLTPLLSLKLGTKLAIAAVAIPHFIGTFIRFWILRSYVDKKIFFYFGISSALGGIIGAFLFWKTNSATLTLIFGLILIFFGITEFNNILKKFKFGKFTALVGGMLSGFLGGLIGNQGGIRSAALLSFDMDKKAFIATATAIGVVVDVVRMPIYFSIQIKGMMNNWVLIGIASIGVIIGTLMGLNILNTIPKNIFRRIVAITIFILGIFMLYKAVNY